MSEKNKQILVYTDFTQVGDRAVEHAIQVTKIFKGDMHLMHIIDDNTFRLFKKKNAEEETQKELEKIKAEIKNKHNIDCQIIVEQGCTCEVINSTAEKMNVAIIVLGIHQSNQLQFLTPKNAIKIIKKSRIPYLCVKENTPVENSYDNIILPLNFLKETKEKVSWAAYFGKLNKSSVKIFLPKILDEYIKNNLAFARKLLKQFNVEFTEINSDKSAFNIDIEAIKYSNKLCKCMLIVMNKKSSSFFDNIFGASENKYISNKYNVPVLILNPRDDLYVPCV